MVLRSTFLPRSSRSIENARNALRKVFYRAGAADRSLSLGLGTSVRVIAIDGEMRNIFLRMLLGLDQDEKFSHIFLGHSNAFLDATTWLDSLDRELEEQIAQNGEDIQPIGIELPRANDDPALPPPWRFLHRAEALAKMLPEEVGALAFIIESERIDDEDGFIRSVEFLADNVKSSRLKFILLDDRAAPRLAELAAEHPRVQTQLFWLDPRSTQQSIEREVESPGASPSSAMLGHAAAFAAADHDHSRAVSLQWRRIMEVEKEGGASTDRVMARLDYSRALLEAGHADPAAETLLQACQLCSAHQLHDLAPLAYTDLGIALNRAGNFEQSFEALRIGNEFFRAQGNLPGEAHVCDTLAKMYKERGETGEAESVWRHALGLYNGITNPHLADVRAAGVTDINRSSPGSGEAAMAVNSAAVGALSRTAQVTRRLHHAPNGPTPLSLWAERRVSAFLGP